ncbi:hypothetical protein [Burkholderia sp. AU6039]|uniref:hypothetical protein n=1 Tax=Burkholderia sp. AU6039 TaxID=2015344 RepID=UPI000B7A8CFC|nr:hypothetical protein [Burkholderia sp. AU6039]OXJ06805.1 hypothetical protein CFB39_37610 [Burkholderia sp. AU6039]
MNASETFDKLCVLIDQACRERSFGIAISGAEAHGMVSGQGNNRWSLDCDFELVDATGAKDHGWPEGFEVEVLNQSA